LSDAVEVDLVHVTVRLDLKGLHTRLIIGLLAMLVALCTIGALAPAKAEERQWLTALSLVDKPKYGPDFKHFDWVNPDAPKGGSVTLTDIGGFDTLNPFPVGVNPAPGIGLIYSQLMSNSPDEPSTAYADVAESVWFPPDFSSAVYRLRKEARFHDGKPITPEDVIWSLETQRKINPNTEFYYHDVAKAEKTGENEVTFTFAKAGNRELPFIVGEIPILPKHFWTANGPDGKPRDIAKGTTELPLGSGPYLIKSVDIGRRIDYERVADYWGQDLPVHKGQNNLDLIRYVTYLDQGVAMEAFKAGEIDFRAENSSKNWATQYDFPALKAGAVKKVELAFQDPKPMQAFGMNLRRSKFADVRTRQALDLAFDFEWSNKNLFFGQYARTSSFFQNQELAAKGLPTGRELEFLTAVKDQVPAEVFTTEYKASINDTPESFRKNLRQAAELLKAAGWTLKDKKLVNDKGEPFTIEFLLNDELFERVVAPYGQNLQRLGIDLKIQIKDPAQYTRRVEDGDFDMVVAVMSQSESPGNEQRDFWSSAAADKNGTRNRIGVKDPAVDKLVENIIYAKERQELIAATRALDRVLLWNYYVIPMWHTPYERLAYWDKYAAPKTLPSRGSAFPTVWWYDPAQAAKVDALKKQ
jgi:microcin C transport system substrate-binding protein